MLISEGYEPRWDIDLKFGKAGEQRVAELLGLEGKTLEIKTDRHLDSPNLFIETHKYAYDGWAPSGLKTSLADYWVYVVGETFTVVATGVLRLALTIFAEELKTVIVDYGVPTRGVLLPRVWLQKVKQP